MIKGPQLEPPLGRQKKLAKAGFPPSLIHPQDSAQTVYSVLRTSCVLGSRRSSGFTLEKHTENVTHIPEGQHRSTHYFYCQLPPLHSLRDMHTDGVVSIHS